MKFASRTSWPLEPNALTRAIELKKASGCTIFDLTQTNPTACGFAYTPELLAPLADPRNLRYDPDPKGLLAAREAVAAYYARRGVVVLPERIFLTSGTSEAYSFVFRLMGEPGDAVLVPKPGYPLLDVLAGVNDLDIAGYRLSRERGWSVDREAFVDVTGKRRVAAIVAVHPNNPTGHFVSREDAVYLSDAAARLGSCLISDEVFFDSVLEPGNRVSFASNGAALTFTLSGLSKFAGLPQMKVAWMVLSGPDADCAEAARRLEMIADATLSVGAPPQRALATWLAAGENISLEISARVARNRARLVRAAAAVGGIEVFSAEGGWHALIRIPVGDEEAALGLLRDAGVLVQPGYLFDFEEDDMIVLSLLPQEDRFGEGLDRLLAWVAARG